MNKKVLITSLALAGVVGLGSLATIKVYADENGNNFPPMIQGLIERFNLNENEVSEYLDEQRAERQAENEARREEWLNNLVSEGTLTEDQKNAWLAFMEEHRADMQGGMQDLTREERQAQMEEHRAEMEAWAEENGIDLSVLHMGLMGPGGDGMGRGGMKHGGFGGAGFGADSDTE